MKTWRVPVTWGMCGVVCCEANTLAEAMAIVEDEASNIPLPGADNANYVDGSWTLSFDNDEVETVRECYNNCQNDE